MNEPAIEIRGLTKQYPRFSLGPISFSVPRGSIVGFIGENGAGKSTTIRAMLDIAHPDAGEALYYGQPLAAASKAIRGQLGVVFDALHLHGGLNAKDMGAIGRSTFPGWRQQAFEGYLARFGLEPDKQIKNLSRGMTMKLQMAYALSHQARVLILDEPTSGLDPVVREEMLDLLLEFIQQEDHAVLISSHVLTDLEKVADYIAFIHQGRLLLFEEKDALREAYGIYACSAQQAQSLDPRAIIAVRHHAFGTQALVRRALVPAGLPLDRPSIEDIMLMMIKGEETHESVAV